MLWILIGSAIFGAVVLAAELVVVNRQTDSVLPDIALRHPRWVVLFRWILGVSSLYLNYPVGEKYIVFGFPFMAAIFERRDQGLSDHLGPIPLAALVANVLFFQLLPQLTFSTWRYWQQRVGQQKESHCA